MARQLHELLRQPERLVAARAAAASRTSSLPPWDVVAEAFRAACLRLASATARPGDRGGDAPQSR
jgi:hypothetical protein